MEKSFGTARQNTLINISQDKSSKFILFQRCFRYWKTSQNVLDPEKQVKKD